MLQNLHLEQEYSTIVSTFLDCAIEIKSKSSQITRYMNSKWTKKKDQNVQ